MATAANTPVHIYLDTQAVRKACEKDIHAVEKACKPDDGKGNHLALKKLLGKKTVERLEKLSEKVKSKHKNKSTANNAWMSHCDGLWIKPVGGGEELEKLEEFKDLIAEASRDMEKAIKTVLEPLVEQVKNAMLDKGLSMAEKKAALFGVKTGARHLAALGGAAAGGVGAIVTEAAAAVWTIGDALYTGYDVIASGIDIYAIANEISSTLDIAQRAQDELAKLAQAAQDMSPTEIMASGMEILARLNPCTRARRCLLVPYSKTDTASSLGGGGCCPGQTGHHVIPKEAAGSCSGYNHDKAPTICVEGVNNSNGSHGKMHRALSEKIEKYKKGGLLGGPRNKIDYEDMRDYGIDSVKDVFPESGCDKKCLRAQLDAYYEKMCKNIDMPAAAGVSGVSRDSIGDE